MREAAERESGFAVNGVDWTRKIHAPAFFSLEARPGGPEPYDDEIALDPATGKIVGMRRHADLRQGAVNLLPFIYDLHESLALGQTGTLILGIVALAWSIDCFVGAYLTLPAKGAPRRDWFGFIGRWQPAWAIRWRGGRFKVFYDIHRAGGLWPWLFILIIAWSSVAFNLPQVYNPVMSALLGTADTAQQARVANPRAAPQLDWRAAHDHARTVMARLAAQKGFRVYSERLMFYDPGSHAYAYRVLSSLDVGPVGNTQIKIDGDSGQLTAISLPTGHAAGTTVTTWLTNIHTGEMLGVPMRVALSITGLAVTSLSVTGVWLWWRKRGSRLAARMRAPNATRRVT